MRNHERRARYCPARPAGVGARADGVACGGDDDDDEAAADTTAAETGGAETGEAADGSICAAPRLGELRPLGEGRPALLRGSVREEAGVEFNIVNAEGDANTQLQQAEQAINAGAKG